MVRKSDPYLALRIRRGCVLLLMMAISLAIGIWWQRSAAQVAGISAQGVASLTVTSTGGGANANDSGFVPGQNLQWVGTYQQLEHSSIATQRHVLSFGGDAAKPVAQRYVRGSTVAPPGYKREWNVGSETSQIWSALEPAPEAALRGVRYTYEPVMPPPSVSTVSFGAAGDGYRVIPYTLKINGAEVAALFVINHHTDSNYLRCRVAATGLACPGWPVAGVAVPLTVGDPFSTGPVDSLWTPVKPTEYLDRAEGKLYFPIAKLGQSTLADVGVLCADLVNKQSCGFFKTGSAMSFGSQTLFNGLGTTDDGRMLMFQHGYRQPDSASRIHCFDLKRKQACAGQPYLHAAYQADSNLDTWNLASVTHGRYTFLAYNGQPQAALMSCWDNVANASCPGFGLKAMASGSRSFMTGVLPKLDATGQLIGACFTSTAACWDVEGRTIRVEAGSNFAYWLAYRPSWPTANQVYVTRKTQVYNFSDGYKKILCYDFATGNFCFNDTSVLSTAPDIVTASSGEFYAVTEDPERPGCVWALGDSSIGVVWDATNGGPCVQKIVKYTINTAPVDYYGFDKTINGEVDYKKIVIGNLPASHVDPNPANGVRATVWAIDADGASVKVVDNQPLVAPSSTQADYVLDLAPYVKSGVAPAKPLTYKNYPRLRTEITIHRAFGSVTWPNDSRADVIWSGPAIQFGVQTRAPANDSLSCLRETFVQSGVFVANSTLAGKTAATTAASNALVERQASASSGPAMLESSFLGYRRKNPEAGEGVPTVAMYAFFDNNLFSGNIGLFDVTFGTAGAATPTSTKLADLHGLTGLRAGTRRAFTSNADGQTVALQWSLLDDEWQDALDRNRGGIKDKAGVDRLAYLRGDRSNEIGRSTGKGLFHPRSDRGTLCDSNGACLFAFKSTEVPDPGTMTGTGLALMLPGVLSGYSEALAPGYSAFQKQSRDKVDGRQSAVLFANSNDDLQGRMWRIDLSELDLEKGLPNNAAKVVMEAANSKGIVQPVVGAPAVVQVGNSSRMVVFASGRPEVTSARYLDSTGSLYSLIGVKDDFKPGELPQTTPPPPRSSCARRSLGAEVPLQIKIKVGPNKPEAVRAAAARGIAGDPMANEKCWAVDLGSGETGIGNAVHNPVGRAVELLSIESPSAANGCRAGRSWINRINALTGKPVGVDVDGDGMIGSDEGAYGGLAIGRSTAIAVNNGKNVATGNASNPANAQGGSGVIAPNTGRIWWREL
ncbi:hypothetical protein VARIO8X_110073 [Burkholderiales bacterium 8X]|nr:hypothetical protein VARIO8X_110073 [Burkholderiales bacterium 8X]